MRILIASDDAVFVRILELALRNHAFEVASARDGEAAWEALAARPADVVISDWSMPGLDGLELCRRLRRERSDVYTYFILATVIDRRTNLDRAMEAGIDDYLTKPINIHELTVRLRVADRIAHMQRELRERSLQLEASNRRLFEAGRRDPLTGVWNRRQMQEDLLKLAAIGRRYRRPVCLVIADVDRFKLYNDRYGHVAGDQVLVRVAEVLDRSSRATDQVYRYGGEEFVITLPEVELEPARMVVGRLCQEVQALGIPHPDAGPLDVLTVSAGLSRFSPETDTSPEAWLRRTDEALYAAKEAGRNRVEPAR